MKKRLLAIALAASMIGSMLAPATVSAAVEDYEIVTSGETSKIILDTDMGYLGDDAWCMYMLVQAEAAGWIDLLGITTTGANVFIAEGVNATLKQLEAVGITDIPVYLGTDIPIMGFRDLAADAPVTGGFGWTGALRNLDKYVEPQKYHDLGELYDEEWGYSETEPQLDMNAAEFMIKSVKENPGEVTILAIGACTNVALACMMDPTFAENTAGIIYMGGSADIPGNSNACGELNWFYDPESAQICLQNDFPTQTIVPNDISEKVFITKDVFDKLAANNNTAITQLLIDKLAGYYNENPDAASPCWDAVTVGVLLCPSLITEAEFRDVAVDCNQTSYSYANSVTWATGSGPYKSTNAEIVFNMDNDAFWTFVADVLGTQF